MDEGAIGRPEGMTCLDDGGRIQPREAFNHLFDAE
jgi:hypothetical protein